jgi:hypothetical protein
LQTCQAKSAATQVHDWVVRRLGGILSSVGHRVKVHNITPVSGKERSDVEIQHFPFSCAIKRHPSPPPHWLREKKRKEKYVCETIGVPSVFIVIRKAAVFVYYESMKRKLI